MSLDVEDEVLTEAYYRPVWDLLTKTAKMLDEGLSPGRGKQKAILLSQVNDLLWRWGADEIKFTRGTAQDIRELTNDEKGL